MVPDSARSNPNLVKSSRAEIRTSDRWLGALGSSHSEENTTVPQKLSRNSLGGLLVVELPN
jgi:hypothetical protein